MRTPIVRTGGGSRRGRLLGGALFVTLVAALLILPPLGQRTVATSDEARFAIIARDMVERGAWFDAQLRGQQYRNKPPLYPWSIAALSLPGGRVTETTAQLPVAVAAIGAVLFTFLLGDRLFGRRAGLWAALILATSYDFFDHSQLLLPDMIVVAFGTLAGYAFWRAVSEPPGRKALVGFYAAVAFAVFAKGPMGLIPFFVAAVWLLTEHGRAGLKRLWVPEGVAVFVLVTAIWLAPFLAIGGQTFVSRVLWTDWLHWYFGVPVPERLANAVLDGIKGFMPWTLVLALPLSRLRREWASGPVRFAFLAFAVPLVVALMSQNQRVRYLLPVYHGGALLVAWWADTYGTVLTRVVRITSLGALLGALAAAVAIAVPWIDASREEPIAGLGWTLALLGLGAVLVGATMFYALQRSRPALLVNGVVVLMIGLLGGGVWVYNAWHNETRDYRRLALRVERHESGEAVKVFGGRFLPLDFYLGRQLGRIRTVEEFNACVEGPGRALVILNGRTWGLIQGQISPTVKPLEVIRIRGQEMLIVRKHDDV